MWPLHRETSLLPVMPYLLLKLCDADPPEAFLWLHELHRVTLKQKGLIVHVILSTRMDLSKVWVWMAAHTP